MKTVAEVIKNAIDDSIPHGHPATRANLLNLRDILVDAFGWHRIKRAEELGFRTVPPGKKWGPRVVVLVEGLNVKAPTPHVAYYDPDTDAAHPAPYWRTVGMTAGWSRRNQPTHFMRPYAVG